jgi:hypothetical protein
MDSKGAEGEDYGKPQCIGANINIERAQGRAWVTRGYPKGGSVITASLN